MHIINNLKANIFLKMDIFDLKEAIIDIFWNYIVFRFYKNISIEIEATTKDNTWVKYMLKAEKIQIILPGNKI